MNEVLNDFVVLGIYKIINEVMDGFGELFNLEVGSYRVRSVSELGKVSSIKNRSMKNIGP